MNHYVLKRMAMAGAAAFSNKIECPFRYANWHTGYRWRPQKTQKEADEVQGTGNPSILGNRKRYERKTLPLSAAAAKWSIRSAATTIRRSTSYEFFLAEVAAYSLPPALPGVRAGTVIGHKP